MTTLKEIQDRLPWGKLYSVEFRKLEHNYKDFQHALMHVFKAAGKLAGMVDDADHGDTFFPKEDVEKYLADVVICAIRAASVNPTGAFDIGEAVLRRIEAKNGVKIV